MERLEHLVQLMEQAEVLVVQEVQAHPAQLAQVELQAPQDPVVQVELHQLLVQVVLPVYKVMTLLLEMAFHLLHNIIATIRTLTVRPELFIKR